MPRLRFFACARCETVYAEVDSPGQCRRCDSDRLDELELGAQAAYFSTSGERR